ncbi:Fic family protein [Candidatus Poriferisodalis sp.]|uniref:Fic family protein n=1 Tax=Candidatus Poriferisodalis sp. TaxID=3101277 RepID=UPI003B5183F2
MLFTTPELDEKECRAISDIEDLRRRLSYRLRQPRRWHDLLRRMARARAVQGSNSIEGYYAPLDDVLAISDDAEPLDAGEETRQALRGYRDAMTYVLQIADDPDPTYSEHLLRGLHFMMISYDLAARPGQWRIGDIFVRDDAQEVVIYQGPDVDEVPTLIGELVEALNDSTQAQPPLVRAAMAHLNLVMIHPFRDGNGRMARCLQTLVLARDGLGDPVFGSLEEYLGANTQSYYDVLGSVGGGSWQPDRDARPWIRFVLTAHLRQGRIELRRVREAERLWDELERISAELSLPERSLNALTMAANGLRVRNATYRAASEELSGGAASRDLRRLVDVELFVPQGEKRGRFYRAAPRLRAIREKIIAARDPVEIADPFA